MILIVLIVQEAVLNLVLVVKVSYFYQCHNVFPLVLQIVMEILVIILAFNVVLHVKHVQLTLLNVLHVT